MEDHMYRCTLNMRTPWCGKPGCEPPEKKTATVAAFEDFEREQGERILDARVRHFLKQYQPEDPYAAQRFSGDLFMMLREIYRDASDRSDKVMMELAKCMPPILPKVGL
jgi:hypothetical protein